VAVAGTTITMDTEVDDSSQGKNEPRTWKNTAVEEQIKDGPTEGIENDQE
jgi:hypothetical protein